jgi:hypothetical protein
MARKFYTVFILPHAHARFRKLHLSRNFVFTLVGLGGVVLTAGLVSPHLVLKVRAQSEQVAQLQAERRRLQAENEQFEVVWPRPSAFATHRVWSRPRAGRRTPSRVSRRRGFSTRSSSR